MADLLPLAALAEAINIPAGELDKLRKNGEVDVTPEEFQTKVIGHIKNYFTDSVERTKTGSWNDGFKAAERKVLTDKERDLRAKFPGIEGKTLDELFENATKVGATVDWMKDPKVQGELNAREEKLRQLQKDLEDAKADKVKTVTNLNLKQSLPGVLSTKFDIPADTKVADKRMELLLKDLLGDGKVEVREVGGKQVPWDIAADKQLQDGNYKDVSLEDWVIGSASYIYEAKTGSGHKAPANKDDAGKGPLGAGDLATIKTWEDVWKYKEGLDPRDKDAAVKLRALNAHVAKLKESGTLKDN